MKIAGLSANCTTDWLLGLGLGLLRSHVAVKGYGYIFTSV